MRITLRVRARRRHRPEVRFGRDRSYFRPLRHTAPSPYAERMNLLDRLAARPVVAANIGLGVVFTGVLAVETHTFAGEGGNWGFDLAVGTVVCVVALLRGRSRTWAAAAGLGVSMAAELAAWRWHLPGQPGGAAVLALLVLIGSAVRASPVRPSAAIVAGGAVV